MVRRIYVEKKKEFANEAAALFKEATALLEIKSLLNVRLLNRYDADNITDELFEYSKKTVFSEPQTDITYTEEEFCDIFLNDAGDKPYVFAVEYLPGQFDQRADSAEQCIQLISQKDRPLIRSAKVYALYGALSSDDLKKIEHYVINPVEARKARFERPETLKTDYPVPDMVKTLEGFIKKSRAELEEMPAALGLAMDADDLEFCRKYFEGSEKRDPTITEIRMIDTYWSDHCRHTTFNTIIDNVSFEDEVLESAYRDYIDMRNEIGRTKPVCLMDIGTIVARWLSKTGKLTRLDASDEVNACTVKIDVETDGKKEPWLLLFKNETHNHPTEIEPFGGAATCIGGAIRDPLSGRAYVYGAMRLTGAANPLTPVSETIPGKLPQRKIVTSAANGYSSYGNQIGLATGIVDELYHPGYTAKRMEIGAVIAAAPEENVKRECPAAGDSVILLGGSTGRDGIGGATGSSKAHNVHSVENCGAEVQKGNAPEERKLQRLFRNPEAARLIKRCNDFGAGGVSVAIGELADGLDIDLDKVPKKYEGLDGTELAISESQERMAVVVAPENESEFLTLAANENLQAVRVAKVKEEPRLTMKWRGEVIVDVSRAFLDTNGAPKHVNAAPAKLRDFARSVSGDFAGDIKELVSDLNVCSKRGLSERFDSTIGAGTVLMPFGGKNQLTPVQAMVQKISTEKGHTDDVSLMSWGFNPYISEKSPYHGAYLAVVESVCKLIACGAGFKDVYLTFQEYFAKPGKDPVRFGHPLAALLGAFEAQKELAVAAIGGKDSMSGTFEHIDVPPTLVSFAVTVSKQENIISPEFKKPGNTVICLKAGRDENNLPKTTELLSAFDTVNELITDKACVSCYTPGFGGNCEAVFKMCIGNGLGFSFDSGLSLDDIFNYSYASFLLEIEAGKAQDVLQSLAGASFEVKIFGKVTDDGVLSFKEESVSLNELLPEYEGKLESVFSCNIEQNAGTLEAFNYGEKAWPSPALRRAAPVALIPVFPGTNCEYDTAKALKDAGAEPEIFIIKNLNKEAVSESVENFAGKIRKADMIFIPGGFSAGDEPDGSGKFITAFFRNGEIRQAVTDLLDNRGGLMCGICNGFQALIKLGLLPYGKILDTDESFPTLTFNTIARHQSRIVRTRIASNKSPWLSYTRPGEIYSVPISHGEGRFVAGEKLIRELAENGQIATQYVDLCGNVTGDVRFNPNNSNFAIEGITSPDGRIFGKMGHSERWGRGLYKNVPGNYDMRMFKAAVDYFKG